MQKMGKESGNKSGNHALMTGLTFFVSTLTTSTLTTSALIVHALGNCSSHRTERSHTTPRQPGDEHRRSSPNQF